MKKTPDNPVITQEQALKITGDKKLLTPDLYEQALVLLQKSKTLAESLALQSAAVAWEAWAKYQHNRRAEWLARGFRLEVARQCAIHSKKERPGGVLHSKGIKGSQGRAPGPRSLLMEHGFTSEDADAALRLARAPEAKFRGLVSDLSRRPPNLRSAARSAGVSPEWDRMASYLFACRARMRAADPVSLAREIPAARRAVARALVTEMLEWCDAFEQAIPK